MKRIIVVIIFCQSSHLNNSNYLSLLLSFYFYFSGNHIDVITILNPFGLLVLYDIFQKKLRNITPGNIAWVKQ